MVLENILKKAVKGALKIALIPSAYLLAGIDQTPNVETTIDTKLQATIYAKKPETTMTEARNTAIFKEYSNEARQALGEYHRVRARIARNHGRYGV